MAEDLIGNLPWIPGSLFLVETEVMSHAFRTEKYYCLGYFFHHRESGLLRGDGQAKLVRFNAESSWPKGESPAVFDVHCRPKTVAGALGIGQTSERRALLPASGAVEKLS